MMHAPLPGSPVRLIATIAPHRGGDVYSPRHDPIGEALATARTVGFLAWDDVYWVRRDLASGAHVIEAEGALRV